MRQGRLSSRVLELLSDGKPRTARQIILALGIKPKNGYELLRYMWRKDLLLRSKDPFFLKNVKSAGRRTGTITNTRRIYLYTLPKGNAKSIIIDNVTFEKYDPDKHDQKVSKARIIADFLKEHKDQAFFAREITDALRKYGVRNVDVSIAIRRLEQKGLVMRRGFRTHSREIPFQKGYLVTWIEQKKNIIKALEEAEERIRKRLSEHSEDNVTWRRVVQIYQLCKSFARDKKIVSYDFLLSKLNCSKYQFDYAIKRALEYYSDLNEIKLFNLFRYFYHTDLKDPFLSAAIEDAKEYIRRSKGKGYRLGHNFEGAVTWFIDRFTNATFWTQTHKAGSKMDPRRITISLIKPVGKRQRAAELDRVWTIRPDIFSQEITYVLECKYGLVTKRHIDQLIEVLKWSRELGVDGPDGRQIRNGVIILFAASSFSNERVTLGDQKLTLPQYAARLNVKLLKISDLNEILHKHGVDVNITIQKVIRAAANESEVKEILDKIWADPPKAAEIIREYYSKNESIFEFERSLDPASKK